MVDVETILASLYAKEISASLEWKSDSGFYPGFGYPAMREKWFRTSGEAVRWLKEQALKDQRSAFICPPSDTKKPPSQIHSIEPPIWLAQRSLRIASASMSIR